MSTQNSEKGLDRKKVYESKRARLVVSFNAENPEDKDMLELARSIEGGFSAWVKEQIALRMATHQAPTPEAPSNP